MNSHRCRASWAPHLWILATVISAASGTAVAAERPHVLMIAIDDLNDWVGHLQGHPLVQTPHLDRLAQRGTAFTNAHCQAPLCNPSRTSVLLGLRPTTTGIYGLAPWFRTLPEWKTRVTLLQHFQQHGYRTYSTGKIFHGSAGGPKERQQEVEVWGPGGGVGVKPPQKLIPPTPMGNHPLMDWGVFPHRDRDKTDYQITDWAIQQLSEHSRDRPFFLSIGYSLPHVPLYVSDHWYQLYPDSDQVLPKLLANDRADTPRFSWYLHWSLPEPRWSWVVQNQQSRNLARSYLASISFIDAQVGRLLEAVDDAGLTESTVIVVWSDHGYHLGEKQITGKNTLWECSTRVPLLFAGPAIATQPPCHEPVELLDIYPTLLELCQLPPRADLEGQSLVTQLQDSSKAREKPAITTHNPGNHGIRSRYHRYIHYADGTEELYDLRVDPEEWHNLASLPDSQLILEEHRRWLPTSERPHAPGSQHRILKYDVTTDTAEWEGVPVLRDVAIPE